MIYRFSPGWRYHLPLPLTAYRAVLIHCNTGFGTMDCCLIPTSLLLHTLARLQCTTWPSAITLTGSSIRISDSLQILGITLDSTLSLAPHINNIVKNCNYYLQALRHIRPSITKEVANIGLPVLLLGHDSITVTLCSTKCLTKTSTNCSEFRIVQHEDGF